MITANVIQRTFQLRASGSSFTGFTIDVSGRQYLCTAKHCLSDSSLENFQYIEIFHDKKWKPLKVQLVGFGSENTDICVLTPEKRLSPPHSLPPTTDGIFYGQEVYFLGFPYRMRFAVKINNGFPFPFVKRATLSALSSSCEKQRILYLDGYNNPGFSGGPVVFIKNGDPKNKFCVAAVISGYREDKEYIVAGDERGVMSIDKGAGKQEPLEVYLNTGIVVSYDIKHAIDAINENPIGVKVE